jgi:CcmD family protein
VESNFIYAAIAFSIVFVVLFGYMLLLTRQVQDLRRAVDNIEAQQRERGVVWEGDDRRQAGERKHAI